MIYVAHTKDLAVKVRPEFLEEQSEPTENHFVWGYSIRIENNGSGPVQLLSRHWRVTDAFGNERRIDGDGVVGLEPVIDEDDFFEYNSGASLKTPSGFMQGTYTMEDENGEEFDIEIPLFSLDSPYQKVTLQ